MKKQVSLSNEERITLLTFISLQIKKNKDCEQHGIEPWFATKDLKDLYQKIAGYEYEER